MWQLGLGEKIFVAEDDSQSDDKIVLWITGRRILYQTSNKDAGHAPRVEEDLAVAYSELDRWVAEEGIFLHADDFRIDEIA
jgi:hypothetical protein